MSEAERGLAVRALALYLPLALGGILWLRARPGRREATGALLAGAWVLGFLPVIHLLAGRFGWWTFAARGGTFLGFPVDLYLGWTLLWGPVAALALRRFPLTAAALLAAALDLAAMPACAPIVVLGHRWWIGEAIAILLCFLPAQLLARWTADDRRLTGRALLQLGAFSAITAGLLPAILFDRAGLAVPAGLLRGPRLAIAAQVAFLLCVPGLSAVQEFVRRGRGTPLPYDPPRNLVTTGVYAYVSNPMQLSISVLFAAAGVLFRSAWLFGAGLMSVVYGAGFASWHEDGRLEERFGARWKAYRRSVPAWRFRLRPFRESGSEPARIWVARGCEPCSEVGAWLAKRQPRRLEILDARDHPSRDLSRLTYEDGNFSESGVAALARALEHIHLGWAFAGWLIRLPGVRLAIQIAVDASGGGPRRVRRRSSPLGITR